MPNFNDGPLKPRSNTASGGAKPALLARRRRKVLERIDPMGSKTTIAPIVGGQPKVDRNAPCPCGSGAKAKRCHPEGLSGFPFRAMRRDSDGGDPTSFDSPASERGL